MVTQHDGESGHDEGNEADSMAALANPGIISPKLQTVRRGGPSRASSAPAGASEAPTALPEPAPRRRRRASRWCAAAARRSANDNCPCGSGKKYKNCHGAVARRAEADAAKPADAPAEPNDSNTNA
ncbi:MAG: SEC-C metal-binding domain-containing protein [Polyangiales bacterium]